MKNSNISVHLSGALIKIDKAASYECSPNIDFINAMISRN